MFSGDCLFAAGASKAKDRNSGVGFGCMGITAFYGKPMETDDAVALLKGVYDGGCRHFDTAEIYKTGNIMADSDEDVYNETVIGKFLTTVDRTTFTVATKFMPFKFESKCDYDTVKKSLTASLGRLGLSYVDVYYCHRIPSKESAIEFAGVAKRLMAEGLIKHVGLSECGPVWLRAAHAVCPIDAIQQEWSLLTRGAEDELVPVCKELGVAVVAYSPLSRNLLATPPEIPKDFRARLPRFQPENIAVNAALFSKVEAMATTKNCSTATLSLAWLLHKGSSMGVTIIAIPGTTKLGHALTNITAPDVALSPDEMKTLETFAATVAGARGDERYVSITIEAQK